MLLALVASKASCVFFLGIVVRLGCNRRWVCGRAGGFFDFLFFERNKPSQKSLKLVLKFIQLR